MGFPRQEYWSGLPFPSPGNLPDPGIEPGSPTLQANSLLSEPPGKPQEAWRSRSVLYNRLWWIENSSLLHQGAWLTNSPAVGLVNAPACLQGNGNSLHYPCLEKSMGLQRVGHDWATSTFTFMLLCTVYSQWLRTVGILNGGRFLHKWCTLVTESRDLRIFQSWPNVLRF